MRRRVVITPNSAPRLPSNGRPGRARIDNGLLALGVIVAFSAVGVQLVALGARASAVRATLAVTEAAPTNFARPDIIDRNGRLLATDVEVPSLFADPALVLDRDELVEKLSTVLPDIDPRQLRGELSDRARRFVWIRRGLSPKIAQKIHDLGLPSLAFRKELRRAYPGGKLAGHVLGGVNIDNKGVAGIEKWIDENVGVEGVHTAEFSDHAPVRLSLDIGVQHSLEDELDIATRRYQTHAAAGLVMDIRTGEIIASASLPRVDPLFPQTAYDPGHIDRLLTGTYELGSVFKTLTVAMALDEGLATSATVLDVRQPLTASGFTIADLHPAGRPLSVEEVFTRSSNVGAAMLAVQAGTDRFMSFMKRVGVTAPMKTEVGPVSAPLIPKRVDQIELMTMSYGHGIAVAPLQFAAATASILNGGKQVQPRYVRFADAPAKPEAVTSELTSREIARLFRLNVLDPAGTGDRAEVPGYRVGGKTGTAERADNGRYKEKAVISSFIGAFPMDQPQYLTFVVLFEPEANEESGGHRTASSNAAPTTARIIARIAPQLGVAPLAVSTTQ